MSEKNYRTDNKSFMVYKDWEEIVAMLDDNQAGALFKALFAFAKEGSEPELDKMTAVAFTIMKNSIERDGIKWEDTCKARAISGRKGGLAKAGKAKQEQANAADTEKEKEKEKENENEKEKDTEKETGKEEDFTKVYLSKEELSDLVGLADRLTIDSYICKIKDWQMKNRKLNTKPYISIKKWLSEDGAVREYKYSRDPAIEEFERYADSIDFSTLST